MIDQILGEIETLDRNIERTEAGDANQFDLLMQKRATALTELSKMRVDWKPAQVERLANLGRATEIMQDRFHFLRGHAVEDMGLLQRHDQLLNLISSIISVVRPRFLSRSACAGFHSTRILLSSVSAVARFCIR